jgi:hypothetical protein
MLLWLKAPDAGDLIIRLQRLSDAHNTPRLASLVYDDVLHPHRRFLWWDLVDTTGLWLSIMPLTAPYYNTLALTYADLFRHPLDVASSSKETIRVWREILSNQAQKLPRCTYNQLLYQLAAIEAPVVMKRAPREWRMTEPANLRWAAPPALSIGTDIYLPAMLKTDIRSEVGLSDVSQSGLKLSVLTSIQSFDNRYNTQVGIDHEIFELLPNLWRNDPMQVVIDKPCSQGCPRCRVTPVRLTVRYTQPTLVNAVQAALQRNIEMSGTCGSADETSLQLCAAMVQIKRVVELVKVSPSHPLLLQYGLSFFYTLLELDCQAARNYPPTRSILAISLQPLSRYVPRDTASQIRFIQVCQKYHTFLH